MGNIYVLRQMDNSLLIINSLSMLVIPEHIPSRSIQSLYQHPHTLQRRMDGLTLMVLTKN